jgi:hypothetical protein
MKFTIYQLFYKDEQIPLLSPLLTPFDNRANLSPNEREYPLLLKCRDRAIQDGLDMWGAVSWNWKIKFAIQPHDILNHINNNPGYDIYFIDPWANHVPIIYNVWEQGQWCHPNMIQIMEEILPMIGVDKNILYQPMGRQTMFWGCMAIGNRRFWDDYFEFSQRYVNCIKDLPSDIRKLHDGNAGYVDQSLNYYSFIQERLMSMFVHISQYKFRILPYHTNEESMHPVFHELSMLKTLALERSDLRYLHLWHNLRNQHKSTVYEGTTIDWADQWIPKFNSSLIKS